MKVFEDADDLRTIELGLLQVEVLDRAMVCEEVATSQKLGKEIDVAIVLHEAIIIHL